MATQIYYGNLLIAYNKDKKGKFTSKRLVKVVYLNLPISKLNESELLQNSIKRETGIKEFSIISKDLNPIDMGFTNY